MDTDADAELEAEMETIRRRKAKHIRIMADGLGGAHVRHLDATDEFECTTPSGCRLLVRDGVLRDTDPEVLRRGTAEALQRFTMGDREVRIKQHWGGPAEAGCVVLVNP